MIPQALAVSLTNMSSDFRPGNIVIQVRDLDGCSEREFITLLGYPVCVSPPWRDFRSSQPYEPRYLVRPLRFPPSPIVPEQALLKYPGESWRHSAQDKETEFPYRSPELLLNFNTTSGSYEASSSICSDTWALGCCLFELRTGHLMFEYHTHWLDKWPDSGDSAKQIQHIIDCLDWRSTPDGAGWQVGANHESNMRALLDYTDASTEEQDDFIDLLGKLWRFRPEDRISVKEALTHEWFQKHEVYFEAEKKMISDRKRRRRKR